MREKTFLNVIFHLPVQVCPVYNYYYGYLGNQNLPWLKREPVSFFILIGLCLRRRRAKSYMGEL